jgi:hypothetical protein
MNAELYQYVTTQSLLTWQRIPIVNTLATTGQEWVTFMSQYNSGTYANQWMIVDTKEFQPNQLTKMTSNFVWIIELAPSIAIAHDVTQIILQSDGYYWPSYNIPYDLNVYQQTGFQAAYETYGDSYSYTNCTRAKLFARDHHQVHDEASMQSMLRYDDYLTDELLAGNAASGISARYDLRSNSPKSYGGIDTKVTSYDRMMKNIKTHQQQSEAKDETVVITEALAIAQSGPTMENNLPAFQWSTSPYNNQIHVGQPDIFNFPFVEMDFIIINISLRWALNA